MKFVNFVKFVKDVGEDRSNAKTMSRKKDVTQLRAARGRETKNSNPAPKKFPEMLPGHVESRMVRCGKKGCKCTRGELHGPYFYHRTWGGERHRRRYVRLAHVKEARAACEEYRALQAEIRAGRVAFKLLMARARELFG